MMRWLVLPIALALLIVPLAGCVGGSGGTDDLSDGGDEDTLGGSDGDSDGEDGQDGRTDRAHQHDRWSGATEMAVVAGRELTLEVVSQEEANLQDQCMRTPQQTEGGPFPLCWGAERFRPDQTADSQTAVVPPGTGWVNLTVSFPEDRLDAVRIWYRDARIEDWESVGVFEEGGGEGSIEITDPLQTDDGHASRSKWSFIIQAYGNPYDDPAGDMLQGELWAPDARGATVTVDAKAIRGPGPLPLEPAHPEWWQNTSYYRIGLVDGQVSQFVHGGVVKTEQDPPGSCPGPSPAGVCPALDLGGDALLWHVMPGRTGFRSGKETVGDTVELDGPYSERLVPPGSDQIVFPLEVTGETQRGVEVCVFADPGVEPAYLGDQVACVSHDGGETRETFTRPLAPEETDSFYTRSRIGGHSDNVSRWRFSVQVRPPSVGGQYSPTTFEGTVALAVFAESGADFETPEWVFSLDS